jgi:hypothetical protein
MYKQESRTDNTGFASGGETCKLGALCFYSSSMQADSFVLLSPPERKARNRYQQGDGKDYDNKKGQTKMV